MNFRESMRRILFCLIAGIIIATGQQAYGQLMIEKAKVKQEITPGETITDYINVHNTSNQSLAVKVYVQDFTYVAPFDGRKEFFPPGSGKFSLGRWINFSPQEFSLPAFGKRKVNYSIRVPPDAQGGHYGVLFFEAETGKLTKERVNLKLVQRVGCLFFLETSDKTKKAEVKDIAAAAGNISGNFLNLGNTILIPQGIFYIMDDNGLVQERGEMEKFYLPPQEEASFSASLPLQLKEGGYTLVITFDLGEGDALVKEIDFSKRAGVIRVLQVRD